MVMVAKVLKGEFTEITTVKLPRRLLNCSASNSYYSVLVILYVFTFIVHFFERTTKFTRYSCAVTTVLNGSGGSISKEGVPYFINLRPRPGSKRPLHSLYPPLQTIVCFSNHTPRIYRYGRLPNFDLRCVYIKLRRPWQSRDKEMSRWTTKTHVRFRWNDNGTTMDFFGVTMDFMSNFVSFYLKSRNGCWLETNCLTTSRPVITTPSWRSFEISTARAAKLAKYDISALFGFEGFLYRNELTVWKAAMNVVGLVWLPCAGYYLKTLWPLCRADLTVSRPGLHAEPRFVE